MTEPNTPQYSPVELRQATIYTPFCEQQGIFQPFLPESPINRRVHVHSCIMGNQGKMVGNIRRLQLEFKAS